MKHLEVATEIPIPRLVEARAHPDGLVVTTEHASILVNPDDEAAVAAFNAMFRSEWSDRPIRGNC